jgi:hypothetical protein
MTLGKKISKKSSAVAPCMHMACWARGEASDDFLSIFHVFTLARKMTFDKNRFSSKVMKNRFHGK